MKLKIAMALISAALATTAHSGVSSGKKEFGHWTGEKRADEFNPNIKSCSVQNVGWYPETSNSPEFSADGLLRLYVDRKALNSSGGIDEGSVAMIFDWDYASERWEYSSDLNHDGTDGYGDPIDAVARVDGKVINLTSPNLPEELKGKVELTYRYTASYSPNKPVMTHTISLIGFTQAWNYANELCNG